MLENVGLKFKLNSSIFSSLSYQLVCTCLMALQSIGLERIFTSLSHEAAELMSSIWKEGIAMCWRTILVLPEVLLLILAKGAVQ